MGGNQHTGGVALSYPRDPFQPKQFYDPIPNFSALQIQQTAQSPTSVFSFLSPSQAFFSHCQEKSLILDYLHEKKKKPFWGSSPGSIQPTHPPVLFYMLFPFFLFFPLFLFSFGAFPRLWLTGTLRDLLCKPLGHGGNTAPLAADAHSLHTASFLKTLLLCFRLEKQESMGSCGTLPIGPRTSP